MIFSDGQTDAIIPFTVLSDNDPSEGCETVIVGIVNVSGNGSAAVNGGIHDVSAEAVITIEGEDFTSAVLQTTLPTDVGGLSPATAEVGIVSSTNGTLDVWFWRNTAWDHIMGLSGEGIQGQEIEGGDVCSPVRCVRGGLLRSRVCRHRAYHANACTVL